MKMYPISKERFDALCYVRDPLVRGTKPETEDAAINKEIEWYTNEREILIANIFIDKIDADWGFIVLGRDARRIYRCIYVGVSFISIEAARIALDEKLAQLYEEGKETYPQGDEDSQPHYIYKQVVPPEKLHRIFRYLVEDRTYEAAKNLIEEIVYTFTDPDGNFIRDFQTNGFDARLWEIFLYVYLHESGFEIDRSFNAPDYAVKRGRKEICIEAVTVNPSRHKKDLPEPSNQDEINERLKDYMPIKFGSALYSKLNKKYWEKDHVKGKPLIIAIHDYHQTGSMVWSRTALSEYLYARRIRLEKSKNGETIIVQENIEFHEYENKKIPSGFFKLADAKNISGVLFTSSATITKFNRMGKIAGLGSENVKMFRMGHLFDPHPDSFEAIPFVADVSDPSYKETWSESLVLFHNPNTLHPIKPELFPDITHIKIHEDGLVEELSRPYEVVSSRTFVFRTRDE
jgi:hypothetical protein